MTPQQYAQNKAASSGSSFYYAFRFLPEQRRLAITAFYAFCREVDDVVDETQDMGVAQTKLAWWRKEVVGAFEGQPQHPVMKALMPHTQPFDIRADHLLAVIEGCEMDLQQNRYLDFPGLSRYCHLVAGVVGEVASSIFGRSDPGTIAYAHKLGLAMQLTNIIRDVGDDARRAPLRALSTGRAVPGSSGRLPVRVTSGRVAPESRRPASPPARSAGRPLYRRRPHRSVPRRCTPASGCLARG